MTRTQLLNALYRRTQTVKFSTETVKFLDSMNRPWGGAGGQATEVDGDALALLKAVSS